MWPHCKHRQPYRQHNTQNSLSVKLPSALAWSARRLRQAARILSGLAFRQALVAIAMCSLLVSRQAVLCFLLALYQALPVAILRFLLALRYVLPALAAHS